MSASRARRRASYDVMYKAWIGGHYPTTRTLLIGESAYDWEQNGRVVRPGPDHSSEVARHAIASFAEASSFAKTLTRALCGVENPNEVQRESAWNKIAFTNYIENSVGQGARTRPSDAQWKQSHDPFLRDLQELKPRRIAVIGRDIWKHMPKTDQFITEDVQGYRLSDGSMAICHAFDHPSHGLAWKTLATVLHFALAGEESPL